MNRTRLGFTAASLLTAATVLAACAPPPADTPSTGGTDSKTASDFVPCMVSDTGGFDDKSFNEAGFEGISTASQELGVEPITVQSASETAFAPNLDNLLAQGCDLIVSTGYLLVDATTAAAEANPEVSFSIIDDNSIELPNVKSIVFETSEAAFLAGYAAAAYSKSGIVGTYGGVQIPPVTIFMDGFVGGVAYYNEKNDASVRAIGWDLASQTGSFTGGFAAGIESKTAAQGLIDQGADVIMAVGGPIFLSAGEAIRDSKKDIALIGVDSDNAVTAPEIKDLFLTSVLKTVSVGVSDVVTSTAEGNFSNEPFIGTLENGGVSLAPFHDFEDKVPADLQAQLDEVAAGIVDGSITVESPASLTK